MSTAWLRWWRSLRNVIQTVQPEIDDRRAMSLQWFETTRLTKLTNRIIHCIYLIRTTVAIFTKTPTLHLGTPIVSAAMPHPLSRRHLWWSMTARAWSRTWDPVGASPLNEPQNPSVGKNLVSNCACYFKKSIQDFQLFNTSRSWCQNKRFFRSLASTCRHDLKLRMDSPIEALHTQAHVGFPWKKQVWR